MKLFFGDTKPGGQLLALALMFVGFFVIFIGITVIFLPFMRTWTEMLWVQALNQIVLFGCPALLFAYLFKDKVAGYYKLGKTDRFGIKLVGTVALLLCLLPLSDWLAQVNDAWHLPQSLSEVEEALRSFGEKTAESIKEILFCDSVGRLISNIIIIAVVPALFEELFFRGALQQILCGCFKNVHVGILVTAALFSLFHGEIFAFLPRFMLGVFFGYLFYYGGSLWLNVTAHFLNNAILVVLYYLANKGIVDYSIVETFNFPWYVALIGTVAAVAVFYYVFNRKAHTDLPSD